MDAKNEELTNLQKITDTQQKVVEIKSSLCVVLNSIDEDPSTLQTFATSWRESSTVKKIATGSLTIIPGIATPVLKSLGILLLPGYAVGALAAMSVGSFVFYKAIDEHNDKGIESKLKKGILSLGDLLGKVILDLDAIREDLTQQIQQFKSENLKLRQDITHLGDQIEEFTKQIHVFKTNNEFLGQQRLALEAEIWQLKNAGIQNEALLKQQEQALADFTRDQEKNQAHLDNKIIELDLVKKTMHLELEKARRVSSTLQNTVHMLSQTSIKSEADREIFKEKMDQLLAKGEADLNAVNERISNMEAEFDSLLGELKQSNALYKEVLQKEEAQLLYLEKLTTGPNVQETRGFLASLGLFKPSWPGFIANPNAQRVASLP